MNLSFNSSGEIILNTDGSLLDADNQTAELNRLHMLVDIRPGDYQYDEFFGIPHDMLVGKVNISEDDVSFFELAINNALAFNNLLTDFTVSVTKLSQTLLQVDLIGSSSDITWLFKTKNGKLIEVIESIPDIVKVNFVATTEYLKSNGSIRYNINYIFRKNKEQNGLDFNDIVEYSHRVSYTASGNEQIQSERVYPNYEITENLETLILKNIIPIGKSIIIEVWPKDMSSIEEETNPFLLRK